MSKKNQRGNSDGIGLAGLLGVVFVTLKLTEVIDWSWWWVTLPFWGALAFAVFVVLVWTLVELLKRANQS